MDKSKIIIKHPKGNISLEELQKSVDVAKKDFGAEDFCFINTTVQSLIDKIVELHELMPTKAINGILFDTIGQEGTVDVGNGSESIIYYFTNDDTIHCQKEDGTRFYTHYKSLVH